MDVVREVAAAGESAELTRQAAELAEAWGDVRTERDHEASSGLMNVWATFEGLVQEIAGTTPRYGGGEWLTNAIVLPWPGGDPQHPGARVVCSNAEVSAE